MSNNYNYKELSILKYLHVYYADQVQIALLIIEYCNLVRQCVLVYMHFVLRSLDNVA